MLYLDDLRSTPEGFDRVYSYEEFVTYLEKKGYLILFLLITIWVKIFQAMTVLSTW